MGLSEELGTGRMWTVYQNGIGYRRPLRCSYHLRTEKDRAKKLLKHILAHWCLRHQESHWFCVFGYDLELVVLDNFTQVGHRLFVDTRMDGAHNNRTMHVITLKTNWNQCLFL